MRLNPRRRRSSTMPPPFFPIPRTVCVGAASEWGRGPLEAGCGLARGDRASALATRNGTRRRVSGACRSAARHGRATRRATRGKSWLPREGGRDRYTSYIYMADTRTHDNHINAMSMRLRPKTDTHATLPHTMIIHFVTVTQTTQKSCVRVHFPCGPCTRDTHACACGLKRRAARRPRHHRCRARQWCPSVFSSVVQVF